MGQFLFLPAVSFFATTLANILIERDLSQVDLSRLTGMSQGQISGYVSGAVRPTADGLTKLCQAVGVDGPSLCVSYLRDLIPKDLAEDVEVNLTEDREYIPQPPEDLLASATPAARKALRAAAHLCERRPKFVKALSALVEISEPEAG